MGSGDEPMDASQTAAFPSLGALLGDYRRTRTQLVTVTDEFAAIERRLELLDGHGDWPDPPLTATPSTAPPATLEIGCLGRFCVTWDGKPVEVPTGGKSAAVLKFLASRGGRPTPRDLFFEAVWPGVDADLAANRLRVALYGLRHSTRDAIELVVYDDGQYRIAPDARLLLDFELFEAQWELGQRFERGGQTEQAAAAYASAERLYRGDFLEDDSFVEWTVVRREYLRDLYLNLLLRLATLAYEHGDEAGCVSRCHKILREDPCSEDAYGLLIRSHLRRGRRARALSWFGVCERTLRAELDVAPSPAIVALRDQIVADRPTTPDRRN